MGNQVTPKQKIILFLTTALISITTFIAVNKSGTFDRESHIPIAMTLMHNKVFPPRDCFYPEYTLFYHYGGDLLAGVVAAITSLDISIAYEAIASILSGFTFLSLFILAKHLSSTFTAALLTAFCAYFGGGLLWLDALFRYTTRQFPVGNLNWSFFETFLNTGLNGGINNAPSVLMFISTTNLGYPLLIWCLIVFWSMGNEKHFVKKAVGLLLLLFALYLTADWLYMTFLASILVYLIVFWKDNKLLAAVTTNIVLISQLFNHTIGNPNFLQPPSVVLGRNAVFNLGIKEHLFTVIGWGRTALNLMDYQKISCFSWDFICEFGLSLLLLPAALFYLFNTKNRFAWLLFFTAATTMPIPLLIDFKFAPVELVRLFSFGNTMLILLITYSITLFYQPSTRKYFLILLYVIFLCLSPISQLLLGAVFSPSIYSNRVAASMLCTDLSKITSPQQFFSFLKAYGTNAVAAKNNIAVTFREEITFLKKNSKPGDVALSAFYEIPAYAGVYSIIPPKTLLFWDQLYSSLNTFLEMQYAVAFTELGSKMLKRLNIKWIIVNEEFTSRLPLPAQKKLKDPSLFTLKLVGRNKLEIYYVK